MVILRVKQATTLWQSMRGLIGLEHPYPLFFKTRFGIHTFGVRFPIDVVILDKKNTVVVSMKDLKPNRFFFWQPKWDSVIELPRGTIEKYRITIGTPINLVFTN